MTCTVDHCKTKKKFREYAEGNRTMTIHDPSIVNPRFFYFKDIKEGQKEVVTNSPERTWFATIERKNGKLVVK